MNKEEALRKIEELQDYVKSLDNEVRDERKDWTFEVDGDKTLINGECVCELFWPQNLKYDINEGKDLEIANLTPPNGYEFRIQEGFFDTVLALVKKSRFKVGDLE